MSGRAADAQQVKRLIAWWAAVLAFVGVVGLFVRPDLVLLWVFLIAFGVAPLPRYALTRLREFRARRAAGEKAPAP
jgi:cyanate permease